MISKRCSGVIIAVITAVILAVNLSAQNPIRIMPLGDSITYGSSSPAAPGGYRLPLYTNLVNLGYNVDMVGDNTGNPAPGLGTEVHHSGHGGWRISHETIGLYEYLYDWFENYIEDPHVVLIHAGTNDTNDPDFEHCIDELDAMVTRIAHCQPSAKIIVTTLMKRGADDLSSGSYINITNYFNPYVYPLVTNHVARGENVYYLDMHAYVELDDMNDNLHPNEVGYAKMAAAWLPAITNIIGTNPGPNLPSPMRAKHDGENRTSVQITFNKTVSPATATNTANYVFDGGLSVTAASISGDHRSVTLTTDAMAADTTYTVTMNNIEDETTPTALTIPTDSTVEFDSPAAPTLISATGSEDNLHVDLLFSKSISLTSATNTANYAIDYGVSVQDASLSSDHLTVTLTTSAQEAGTNYTVTVNNITDESTPTPITIAADSQVSFIAQTPRGYGNYIPESEYGDYTLVYSLDIPNNPDYDASSTAVSYSVDNSDQIDVPFSRVAYYLELQKPGEALQYLWVSVDAFTAQAGKLGVPTFSSGVIFQQILTNMNIYCNVAGVTTGTDIQTGNIEFWPYNYGGNNYLGIPNAASTYDFGDQCSYPDGNYGSMQIHNHGASQTLLAFNHWNSATNPQIGIGNDPDTGRSQYNPDYTFGANGTDYEIKTLQVLVKCDISLDTTPPAPVSAIVGVGGNVILVTFNEKISTSPATCSLLTPDDEVELPRITLLDDQKTLELATGRLPLNTPMSVVISNVRDLAGNCIPPGTTIEVTTLPVEITNNIGSMADGYRLVYSLDIPVKGDFNSVSDFYDINQSSASVDFNRIAYYLELEDANENIQYLWASMDAFTTDLTKIGVPVSANGQIWQQTVDNLDVKSNVAGISNGVAMVGGNLEFWPSNYQESNGASIPGASDSYFDFGDTGASTTAGHGSMQIHNYMAQQTLFAMNNFGVDNNTLAVGIGNRPGSSNTDWTHAANSGSYTRRTLHILVRPDAAPELPAEVEANVPQAPGYQLAYTIDIPTSANFYDNSPAYYTVNNYTNGLTTEFSRIAYYMELHSGSTTQWVWTAMDAFTTDARRIGVPTNNCTFQQKVRNLEVLSNVDGIINGTEIDTGNIEFWPSNYNQDNSLPVPNALSKLNNTNVFDFGDGNFNSTKGHGSMQVHNYGAGQTIFAINSFNNGTPGLGIGNNTDFSSNPNNIFPDWTFSYNANSYSYRRMHVFVLPGTISGDTTAPTLIRATASASLDKVNVQFSETVCNTADTPSFYSINNGATVSDAMLSSDGKHVVLSTSALTPGQSYTITVTGVRDASANYNAIVPYSTVSFTAPSYVWPDVLTNVAETAEYQLIHQLAVANRTSYQNGCNYTIDQSYFPATQGFDRIAYCMELQDSSRGYHWVYVSMDAFTTDLSKIGVPTFDRGTSWQQIVSNLNVYASANIANTAVTTGVGIATGNIEFWPYNYSTANAISIPGANGSTFDFGDIISGTTAGYGSMQVHNYAKAHTIFAMNNWASGTRQPCIGIGNDPRTTRTSYNPDYTFGDNADSYTLRNLYVLVRPAEITSAGSPPEIWSQPQSQSHYLQESAILTVYSPDATGYQWRKNGAWIEGATYSWLEFDPVETIDDAVYDVVVSGADGYIISDAATLQIYPYTEPQDPKPIRIMPLGDSITYGSPVVGGYRLPLYDSLTAAGYNVDYVGTQTSNSTGMADPDHEGHSGWTIGGLDSYMYEWLAAIDDPDIILLHIGTNDSGAADFYNRIDALDNLVTKIAVARPNANIIVTTLMIRSDETRYANITNLFNPYVYPMVTNQVAQGHKVHYLDMHAYLDLDDMADGLHPNATGYGKMADAWFGAITNIASEYGDSSAPALIRANAMDGLESVEVDFSKAMDPETVTNTANYSLDNGVTITGATLSDDQRTVVLTTSPLSHNVSYTLTVNDVKDYSWPVQQTIAPDSSDTFTATLRGYLNNVEESADYHLVYAIDLPRTAAYGGSFVNYSTDNSDQFRGPLNRVAYYLELQTLDQELSYVWVSMDAFTEDVDKIGIPTKLSGAVFQQYLDNMNIDCNVAGVTTGTNLSGNIEFWPFDYGALNTAGIPGASGSTYDFGDERRSTGSHGSMQIHNYNAGQTLFAFNNWGSTGGATPAIGIGNCPSPINGGVDWTFSNNAGNYTVKALYVLAKLGNDDTPPTLVSAVAGSAGTLVSVTFSEMMAEDSIDGRCFSLDHGVSVIAATLRSDGKTVNLITTPQPAGTTLTLTVTGVCDSSGGNPIAPGSTITVSSPTVPPEVAANAGALADGFELVYTLDIPVTGNLNALSDPYIYNQSCATSAFDRIAYYLELVTAGGTTQYVWTAMDAFTPYRAQIGVPLASTKAFFQQTVSNLDVKSNVAGVDNGTGLATGNIEFWPNSYGGNNAISIPNASSSTFDFGDEITGSAPAAGYGSMQVHNYGASETVFGLNRFGTDGSPIGLGIGNRTTLYPDWTHADNAGTYARRTLHVMVRPCAPTAASDLPSDVASKVGSAANGYELVCSITNIPVVGDFDASNAAYIIDKRNLIADGSFRRVAYYLELETTTSNQWVWTAMDTFTEDPDRIGVPLAGAIFQQRVNNLDVLSNDGNIQTGTGITTGNIEFWPGNYNQSNAIGIPNASGTYFDFGDGGASSGTGHGCMQVHNYGAQQTIWAMNHFNSGGTALGIGNENEPGTGHTDYTFTYNAGNYTKRVMHIFVLPGCQADSVKPSLSSVSASRSLNKLLVTFSEELADNAASSGIFTIDQGITVTHATLWADKTTIELETSTMTSETAYTLTVSGVSDRSPSGNLIEADSTIGFTTPSADLPAVLSNVPEIGDYTLIHQLAIGNNVNWNPAGADYSIDESYYSQTSPFDRIAYCMELTGTNGFAQWVYVSADAFTGDITKIGVPGLDRNVVYQQYISNLNVYASANIAGDTITTGSGISTGNIEFWPNSYSAGNAINIPGASGTTYDFGDTRTGTTPAAGYGSMQVHNTGAQETIFSLSHWGGNGYRPCLGIGSQPTGNPDWTFKENANEYSVKNLYVLVRFGGTGETGDGPEIFVQPTSKTVTSGNYAYLNVYAPEATSYQWRKNGVWITGATQSVLKFSPVSKSDIASYDVLAISNEGSTLSQSVILNVLEDAGTLMILR